MKFIDSMDILKEELIGLSTKHLYGMDNIGYGIDEAIVLCLVKDGEQYIKEFIEHYFKLGFKHIVFLDNGSTDKTIEIAKNYNNITILQTEFPFGKGNNMRMRDYLIDRFAKDRWSLCVDIDEFFDYPYSNILSLRGLINYLNNNRYTAVVTYMLDMLPDNIMRGREGKFDRKEHGYYDISNITKKDYYFEFSENIKSEIKIYFGGIRNLIFMNKKLFCITKHALICNTYGTKRGRYGHFIKSGKIADFCSVLFHYKFTDDFFDKVYEAVKKEQYYKNSETYKQYHYTLRRTNFLSFKPKNRLKFINTNELVDKGFLPVSSKYIDFIAEKNAVISCDNKKVTCPICKWEGREFLPFGIVLRKNAKCPKCGSLERHRLIYLYLKNIIPGCKYAKILHFAPESCIADFLKRFKQINYFSAGLHPSDDLDEDITKLTLKDNEFDIIICSHVLEHVNDDIKAMSELCRVCKPGGFAMILVPLDYRRELTYEDWSIINPEMRTIAFGHPNHVRIYGRDFIKRLQKAGFKVKKFKIRNKKLIKKYGLLAGEEFYICSK